LKNGRAKNACFQGQYLFINFHLRKRGKRKENEKDKIKGRKERRNRKGRKERRNRKGRKERRNRKYKNRGKREK
jgi:hypothetical protein